MVNCDYLTIHVPLTADTKDMVDADMIAKMKDGVRILNFSRDGLVNSTAVLEAVKSGKVAKYVTDFATDDIIGEENIFVFHISVHQLPKVKITAQLWLAMSLKSTSKTVTL